MKVIIGRGPRQSSGAIVIDHTERCFWKDGERFAFGKRRTFRFVAAVLVAWPHHISTGDMLDHIWGDDPGGGPMGPQGSLFAGNAQHADHIAQLGIVIRSSNRLGWRAYAQHETKYSVKHAREKPNDRPQAVPAPTPPAPHATASGREDRRSA